MKLYLVHTKWGLGKIEGCEVIKETEKTFMIQRSGFGHNTIRKSEMRVWDYIVCKSPEEATEKVKQLLKEAIEKSKSKIKQLNADIEKYTTMLADIEKGGSSQ